MRLFLACLAPCFLACSTTPSFDDARWEALDTESEASLRGVCALADGVVWASGSGGRRWRWRLGARARSKYVLFKLALPVHNGGTHGRNPFVGVLLRVAEGAELITSDHVLTHLLEGIVGTGLLGLDLCHRGL